LKEKLSKHTLERDKKNGKEGGGLSTWASCCYALPMTINL
jgi:hypothetical protein